MNNKLEIAFKSLREKTSFIPKIGLVLGSGLGGFADKIKAKLTVPYSDIVGFPVSTVEGHKGQFVFGYLEGIPIVIMQGRVHYYEGYSMEDVVMPIRLIKLLGADTLFLSNAAGGINLNYNPGTLMVIKDHISSFIPSPLIGKNNPDFGPRFPDMSSIYSHKLRDTIHLTAKELNIQIKEGVYIQFTGPQYESPSEIVMSRILGADAVGMSTACEAIVANHMGMNVCGVSCITNLAAGVGSAPLDHLDVQKVADKVSHEFQSLVYNSIVKMATII